MPSLQLFLLFLAADAALKLTPGPDMALTLSRGMTQGFRPAFHSVLGNVAAGFIQVPAVVLGLASVLRAFPALFVGIKAAGGLYLGYLGIKAIIRCAQSAEVSLSARPGDAHDAFWQGFMTNLLNPKVLLFMIAFLPQFTTPDNGPEWVQMLVLGITMKVLILPYGSCFAFGASRIRGWVGCNPWFLRMQQGLLGAIMVGLALYVLYSTAVNPGP
jgi:threonine/homoserine/homoserine lactone efflux protein